MRKLYLLLLTFLPVGTFAQTIFWTENFNNGCTAACSAVGYNSANGTWSQTITGAEGADANAWFVSCAENNTGNNNCSAGCGNNQTLHISAAIGNPFCPNDCGAAYDAGGLCGFLTCPQTNRRIESPTINCTGLTGITVNFNYIAQGSPPNDQGSVWYFDGTTWTQLTLIAPSNNAGCGGQGRWMAHPVINLPASANNNPNVKIGFRWVNNDDGVGTDPSIAIDDLTLSSSSAPAGPVAAFTPSATTVCAGTPVNFTDNSTGNPTSWSWTFPSGTPATATTQNVTGVVWNTAGTYTVTLTASNLSGSSNATVVITVNPLPNVTASANPTVICQGNSTNLTAGGASTYTWNPGNLSGANQTVTPATTTTYTVTGVGANSCQDTAQVTVVVQICAPPVALYTASATSVCVGEPVNFTDNSTGGPTTWSWTFPSGTPATAASQNVNNVVWSAAGTYTVTLTVSNTNGNDTYTATITVNPNPVVTASGNPLLICQGNATNLNASGAATYVWNPGNLSGAAQTLSPATTTTYTVTGTDVNGCEDTAQVIITVQICSAPVASFTASATSVCVGQPVNFTDNSTGSPTSWNWTFPSGTPAGATTQNVNGVVWNTAGTYTVTLDATNANGTSTSTQVITVNAAPTVTVSSSNNAVCSGTPVTLQGLGANSWLWLPGNQTTSSITVTPTATTTYTVTGTSNGCPDTAQITITVYPSPTITTTANPTQICTGQQTTLTASGGVTYTWQPGNLTGAAVTVSPATTTSYTVTATDINGCTGTSQIGVIVIVCAVPNAAATASASEGCEGSCFSFTDASTGNPTSWQWLFPGATPGTSTAQNPTNICYNTPGVYTVTLVATNNFGSDTVVLTNAITINQATPVDAGTYTTVAIGNSTGLSATGGAGSYAWSPSAGVTNPNLANTTATPTVTTTYTVTYTDANGCSSTDTVTIFVVEEYAIFVPSAFSPNGDGANDILFVRGAGIMKLDFIVFDRYGEKVFESQVLTDGWDGTFRGKPMNSGVFAWFVRAEFYNGTVQELKGDVTLMR
jgi:gliding motility-associated-like protein